MGRVCVGRLCYGPSLQWAEFAMGRDVQLPPFFEPFLSQARYLVGLTTSCFAKTEHSLSSLFWHICFIK